MTTYATMTIDELESLRIALYQEYDAFVAKGLSLNMARGKPSVAQLELARPMLDVVNAQTDVSAYTAVDVFNYGALDGIPEAKQLMASIMEVPSEDVIVMGNSSLNIMYDTIARAMTHGILGSTPWSKLEAVKFLCPIPGYDRHFAICEHFGIEMINVPMHDDGPDMDMIERLVAADDSIKGIWCVPKYANPTGICYSDDVIMRMGALTPAASDFRIFWDNAYAVHHLDSAHPVAVMSIREACKAAGHEDLWYMFASTSKVSFAGGGIAVVASSAANIADIKKNMFFQTIGHDKINQLRHVVFFKNLDGINAHMTAHAAILAPKFEIVLEIFENNLASAGIGEWTSPRGGYFISFDGMPGTAKRIVSLAKAAGVTLTGAGATYPYGEDPEDRNIRIAPSYPPLDELAQACELFTLCVKIASVEKLLTSHSE